MVQPLSKPKIIKKFGHKKFKRHQHDRKIAVKVRPEAPGLLAQVLLWVHLQSQCGSVMGQRGGRQPECELGRPSTHIWAANAHCGGGRDARANASELVS